jgi:peptidoglycan/xylan/chitin deacetylase (PgdA/CDA1 family)/outer membrane protein assembly factor BamB
MIRGLRAACLSLALCALGSIVPPAQSQVVYRSDGEVPVCLARVASAADDELLVGYSSGRVVRLAVSGATAKPVWESRADGAVLAVLPLAAPGMHPAGVIVSTATGKVVRLDAEGSRSVWQFTSTCEVSAIAELADVDGDGRTEVLAGGADHRVHLLSGATGKPLWAHFFEAPIGGGYVDRVIPVEDTDRDGVRDVAVYLWSGEVVLLSGRTGEQVWRQRARVGYTDAMALGPDLNGDGLAEILSGGNDLIVRGREGRDGEVVWTGRVERPIRDIVVSRRPAEKGGSSAFVCTAGGELVCFDLKAGTVGEPRWTARMGDVCRGAVIVEDGKADSSPNIAAYAENGRVEVFSSATGARLWHWQASDVVRAICPIRVEGRQCLAAASLDGAVSVIPLTLEAGQDAAAASDAVQAPALTTAPHDDRATSNTRRIGRRLAGGSNNPRVLILLYHDVVPEAFYAYGTSVEHFRAEMDMLLAEKYTCVSLDEIADWIEGKGGMPSRAVCITFDGPYQGHYTYAYPILRERGLFATSYITTDWIGTSNHADWHQLREMDAASAMDVQNHTTNHQELARCSRDEIMRQLSGSNEAIRRHLGGKLARHHAYPAGVENGEVRGILRELGFRTATTVRPRPVRRDDDLMGLPRYTSRNDTTMEQFRAWLTGADMPATRPAR